MWFQDGRRVVHVAEKGARERAGIFAVDIVTGDRSEIQDDDAPRGHEYFPMLAGGDRYLLWGACREGEHDHIDSNYQLFARRLPDGPSIRLTFDRHNNRWPKPMQRRMDGAQPD
jgi:hypothetical protein